MRLRLLVPAFLLGASALLPAAPLPPKLAVLLVVDQMPADYVDRFQTGWSAGLKRLVSEGAWLTRASYPYLTTVTCAGHATISTGAFPSTHGVFQNVWFDRGLKRVVTCTNDETVAPIAYGKGNAGSESGALLLTPSFADEMRRQRAARVVSLSLKARSAIMLAGHGGDAVTWLSDTLDGWGTSTAFAAAPVPEVHAFVTANPIDADYRRVWERLLPPNRYSEADAGLGENPPAGWTTSFPHPLMGSPGSRGPDVAFYHQWELSPYADAYLGRMATALAESMRLGRHEGTDLLAVSFSSPDLVGHAFGPYSQEVRDMFLHLDATIGNLLNRLDTIVGRGRYVVALSSDHGVTPIPEQLKAKGQDGGRLDMPALANAIERAAQAAAGPGKYVSRLVWNDIYLEPGMFEKLAGTSALDQVIKAVSAEPGVARVFRRDELPAARSSRDPLLRAAALSYVPDRGGDLVIAAKSGWMMSTTGTTHGSPNADDQRVPILFYGQGIRPGRYDAPATPADIAPTLAAICGITMPQAQGRALSAVLDP